MELFYTPPENIRQRSFVIYGAEAFHVLKVMRKKIGDEIFITDGQGWQYQGKILEVAKTKVQGEILNEVFGPREPIIKLTLALGVLKGSRNDFVIEKATEIGAHCFQLFYSKNSVTKKIGPSKIARLERVARAAMKQSLRTVLPKILSPTTFPELISKIKEFDQTFIAYEEASGSVDFKQKVARQFYSLSDLREDLCKTRSGRCKKLAVRLFR